MCRKFVLLILVLGMASASYGSTIVGNWESADACEGWVRLTSYTPGGVSYHVQPTGVTLGSWDMKWWETTFNHGQNFAFKCVTGEAGALYTASDWLANTKLEFDVTRLTADWTSSTSNGDNKIYIQMATNTNGYTYTDIPVSLTQGDYTSANQTNNPMHLVADYSAFKALYGTSTYVKIALRTASYNWTTGGVYYIDNVLLTPEPATMCLLGLGALGLLRKRRA